MDRSGHWVHTWAAAPQPAQPGDLPPVPFVRAGLAFANTTLRQTVRVAIGGTRLRLRLSNVYGAAALSVGAASVALPAAGRAGVGAPAYARRSVRQVLRRDWQLYSLAVPAPDVLSQSSATSRWPAPSSRSAGTTLAAASVRSGRGWPVPRSVGRSRQCTTPPYGAPACRRAGWRPRRGCARTRTGRAPLRVGLHHVPAEARDRLVHRPGGRLPPVPHLRPQRIGDGRPPSTIGDAKLTDRCTRMPWGEGFPRWLRRRRAGRSAGAPLSRAR